MNLIHKHLYEATPLRQAPELNQELGRQIHFKLESYQPTRSFKLRGMDYLVQKKTAAGVDRFMASSGGNAGFSLAYACRHYGAYLKVFLPKTTPQHMVTRIKAEGAVVELVGNSWDEAHAAAAEHAIATHSYYVSPFDDPDLWHGHSSMIDECALAMEEPDLVVLAVGGGGLLCGVMQGLEKAGWSKAKVLAMETEGAASFAAALQAGKAVDFGPIHSIARSLGARKVAQAAVDWAQKRTIISGIVKDAEALEACLRFVNLMQVMVEPACGAALSAALVRPDLLGDAQRVLVIACGGATAQYNDFQL